MQCGKHYYLFLVTIINGLYPVIDMCIDSIGMEDGRIPNASLSARFQGANNSIPEHGRLNALSTGWKGNPQESDWLQIDLGSLFKVIITHPCSQELWPF